MGGSHVAGLTLVEVLVALAVLGIGLLGASALLTTALRACRAALHRAVAVDLAVDLAERMRSVNATGSDWHCADPCDPALAGNPLAAATLRAWLDAVTAALPAGTGNVAHLPGAGGAPDTYQVGVQWADPDPASAGHVTLRVAP